MRKVTVKVKEHKPQEDIVLLLKRGTRIQFVRYKGNDAIEAHCVFGLLDDIREKGLDIPLNNTNFRILIKEVVMYNRSPINMYTEEYRIVVEGELV